MNARDFQKLEHGPFGLRWSYTYDSEEDSPPSISEAEVALGEKLAPHSEDTSDEREDGLSEEVYFAAKEYSPGAVQTYRVQ